MDSLEIIRTIISEPPKPANSIQLEFSDIENNITSKELFELLLMMFTEAMKVLYGENGRVELSKISRNNFNRINEYFNSFGFTINYEILPENDTTKIFAWRYTGGVSGLIWALVKAFRFLKKENQSLKNLLLYAYYFAGNWELTDKLIELNYSNKACMTSEIYPNENEGRIILCTMHPEYLIWWNGYIQEVIGIN